MDASTVIGPTDGSVVVVPGFLESTRWTGGNWINQGKSEGTLLLGLPRVSRNKKCRGVERSLSTI